jgi:hypothetical protein
MLRLNDDAEIWVAGFGALRKQNDIQDYSTPNSDYQLGRRNKNRFRVRGAM